MSGDGSPPERRFLVTGAAGFLGRRLVARLVAEHGPGSVTALLWREGKGAAEAEGRAVLRHLGVVTVEGDLLDPASLRALPREVEGIFHLASNLDTGARDHRVNDVGTRNLIEAVGPLGARQRVIFTSSIAVTDHRQPWGEPANERSRLRRPRNEYGRRKLVAERWLEKRARCEGFSLRIVRPPALWGRGTRPGGVFDWLARLVRGGHVVARLDFPGKLSLLHVDDMAEILCREGRGEARPGEVGWLLPAAEVLTIGELLALCHRRFGRPWRPVVLPRRWWGLCDHVGRALLAASPLLPQIVANRLWQLWLTVADAFVYDEAATRQAWPDLPLRRLQDHLEEVW